MAVDQFQQIQNAINAPFWSHAEFWIASAIGIAGLVFSILAFREARQAKRAATEAGKTVKVQTVAIELTEISQGLDRLNQKIGFSEARDYINGLNRRLRRLIAPFERDDDLANTISLLKD